MTAPVFVDTNIFVYARQANERLKQPVAVEWLETLWERQIGRTSMQVLCECYVTFRRKIEPALSPAEAWDQIRSLLLWNPQPTDSELLLRAQEVEQRYRLSWWDSMIVGAAQLQNCALLLTEDLQDRATYGGVTVRNPFTLGVSEAMATYTVTPAQMPGHPRRGRPRRASHPGS
ncbi:MAG TPA: PIN domain-containing protein [Gammaproteobacteria bacterium]|nr:PIN domain-containing protein [Gammaproteobacteria bacterium]